MLCKPFPLEDYNQHLDNNEIAIKLMQDLKLMPDQESDQQNNNKCALPISYNKDFNMETDESFSRIFF